jgi:pimeloyl-ACP methyl ester carboxylesterase
MVGENKERVHFYSAGHRLTAFWYPPAHPAVTPGPAIIVCHGFSGMIDVQLVGIPESLSAADFGVLTFYCRGIGESEGPRGRVMPWEQVEDTRNAVTYLQARPDVAAGRIGLFGSAWGCSIAVATAAKDQRVACVVGTVGIGDCERWLKSERPRWEWAKFLKRLDEDRTQRVLTGESTVVHPNEIHIPDRAASAARDKQWNEFIEKSGYTGYPLETAEALIEFKPVELAHLIAPRPLMLIHMEADMTVPVEESITMYEAAGQPKKLVVMADKQHYDTFKFTNPIVFEEVMMNAIEWYARHLGTNRALGSEAEIGD